MFHLNSSSPSGTSSWDSNFARLFLKISDDQLEKLKKIPGWSKKEISDKSAIENEKKSGNIEKQSVEEASASTKHILTTGTNAFSKDNDIIKHQNLNSELQSKQNPVALPSEKELFLKNVSLSPLREKHTHVYSLQRSSSLPDLSQTLLSHGFSEEIYRKKIRCEKDVSKCKLTENILNKASAVSNDCSNGHKLSELDRKHFSNLLGNPNRLSKPFKTLDDSILSYKYFKDSEAPVAVSSCLNRTDQIASKQEMSSFEKRLLLLEKRLSPSKETSPPLFNSKSIDLENIVSKKCLKSSSISASSEEVTSAVKSFDIVQDLPDEKENSSMSKTNKSFESPVNSHIMNEKSDAQNGFKSPEDKTGIASKSVPCNFESFLSPPVPCGQPVPTEVSCPQDLIELNAPSKLLDASPPVSSAQLIPKEVPSLSQPILSQKSTKLNTGNKSQNAELVGKVMAPEKPSGGFSVFAANLNEKNSDLASNKESGTKRKRKSKNEKSSKRLDAKKQKRTYFQFSATQIRNMIEIMKIFHTEF